MAKTNVIYIRAEPAVTSLGDLIDQLGSIEARIARLQEQADALRDSIKEGLRRRRASSFTGDHYKVSLYQRTGADGIDRQALYRIISRKQLIRHGVVTPGEAHDVLTIKEL